MSKPYFYIIEHIKSGKYYAGVRFAKNCNKEELLQENGYYTSSKYVKELIESDGLESFKIRKIKEFDTAKEAMEYETRFLKKVKARNNDRFINKSENETAINFANPNNMKKILLQKYGYEYSIQIPFVMKKIKQKCLQKYGVEYFLQSKEIRQKGKETNLKKYGFEHAASSNIIKNKIKNTCQQRYGTDAFFQSDEFKEKTKQSTLRNYGVEYMSQVPEIRQKISENQLGDKHHKFCGYFITPFGKFGSSHEAARNNKLIDRKRVYMWCKNPNKIISKSSFSKNSYLNNTFDESIIGKTFGELGFNFEEITK